MKLVWPSLRRRRPKESRDVAPSCSALSLHGGTREKNKVLNSAAVSSDSCRTFPPVRAACGSPRSTARPRIYVAAKISSYHAVAYLSHGHRILTLCLGSLPRPLFGPIV